MALLLLLKKQAKIKSDFGGDKNMDLPLLIILQQIQRVLGHFRRPKFIGL
jgi:hypothetical protein